MSLALIVPQCVWAATDQPVLLKPAKGSYFKPKTTLRIQLPPALGQAQQVKLEVDQVDVTELTKRNGNILVYSPVQPLTFGVHEVRLVEFAANGNILERGKWKVEVRKSRLFRESQLNTTVDLKSSYRAADDGLTAAPKKSVTQGTVGFEGNASNKKWKFTGKFNGTIDSQAGAAGGATTGTSSKQFDMNDYLFTGDAGRFGAKVGHHQIEPNNLIMSDFNRRGVSTSFKSKNEKATVTGFSMRTETITGFRNGLGVSDSNHRVSGIVGTYVPFKENPQRLHVTTTYIDGKGNSSGEGDAGGIGADVVHGSRAWGIAADSTTKNNRWRFRAEYAQSEFDFDGINNGFKAERDSAYSLLAVYTAKEKVIKKNPLTWNVSVEHKKHGTFFKTLTNPGLPSDRYISRVNFNLNFKGYTLAGSVGQDEDNVEDDDTVPQTRNTLFNFTFNYAPQTTGDTGTETDASGNPLPKKKKKTNIFAQPNYSVSYARTDQYMKRVPLLFVGTRTDVLNDVINFNASFTPGKWSWTFGQSFAFTTDGSTPVANQNDTKNYTTQLTLTYPINDKISINPTLQYNTEDNETTNVKTDTTTLGVSSSFVLVRNKLTGTLNYSYNQIDTSDNSNDTDGSTVDLGLTWTLKPVKTNRPGVEWFLNGNWQNTNTANDTYQVFTGIHIGWSHSR